jgi:hypothetical protein
VESKFVWMTADCFIVNSSTYKNLEYPHDVNDFSPQIGIVFTISCIVAFPLYEDSDNEDDSDDDIAYYEDDDHHNLIVYSRRQSHCDIVKDFLFDWLQEQSTCESNIGSLQ